LEFSNRFRLGERLGVVNKEETGSCQS